MRAGAAEEGSMQKGLRPDLRDGLPQRQRPGACCRDWFLIAGEQSDPQPELR